MTNDLPIEDDFSPEDSELVKFQDELAVLKSDLESKIAENKALANKIAEQNVSEKDKLIRENNKKTAIQIAQEMMEGVYKGDPSVISDFHEHAASKPARLAASLPEGNTDHYRWVSKKDSKLRYFDTSEISRRESMGYQIVLDKDGELGGPRFSGGDRVETDDLVLMKCSKETAAREMMRAPMAAKRKLSGVNESARNLGIGGEFSGQKKTYSSSSKMMDDVL